MIPATPESATPTHCRRRKTRAALFLAALNLHSDCVTLRSAIAFESSACFVAARVRLLDKVVLARAIASEIAVAPASPAAVEMSAIPNRAGSARPPSVHVERESVEDLADVRVGSWRRASACSAPPRGGEAALVVVVRRAASPASRSSPTAAVDASQRATRPASTPTSMPHGARAGRSRARRCVGDCAAPRGLEPSISVSDGAPSVVLERHRGLARFAQHDEVVVGGTSSGARRKRSKSVLSAISIQPRASSARARQRPAVMGQLELGAQRSIVARVGKPRPTTRVNLL